MKESIAIIFLSAAVHLSCTVVVTGGGVDLVSLVAERFFLAVFCCLLVFSTARVCLLLVDLKQLFAIATTTVAAHQRLHVLCDLPHGVGLGLSPQLHAFAHTARRLLPGRHLVVCLGAGFLLQFG